MRRISTVMWLTVTVCFVVVKTASAHDCSSPDDCLETAGYNATIALVGGFLGIFAGLYATRLTEILINPLLGTSALPYSLNPGVLLSDQAKRMVGEIARNYSKITGASLVITSGTRDARSQAGAMYNKLAEGDHLKVYENQDAAREIRNAYEDGVAANRTQGGIIEAMTNVIKAQVDQGTYISKHLRSEAVDVRSIDMSPEQNQAFRKAAEDAGATVILEGTPPHFHIQWE